MKNTSRHYPNLTLLLILCCSLFAAGTRAASIANLLITEVMANPQQVTDSNGEWFELFNPTTDFIDLQGLILSDDGSNQHTIASSGPLGIAPGQYFVLGRNGDSSLNGGLNLDYVYSNFTLANSMDQIIFSDGLSELLRLDYSGNFAEAGRSMELLSLPMNEGNYTPTAMGMIYGSGDIGTPGAAGSVDFSTSTVPVPAAIWLFGTGLMGLAGISRLKRNPA
ncbi:MAG: lamin tail domain-containing protein [Gammaproteobacteria bacterium]|nr:lamin tail domain-containing protein [Gammaproteobacteria bacterium]